MKGLDAINPNLPVGSIGQELRREQSGRDRQRSRQSAGEAVTDDMGDRREEPPLIDDFA